MVKSLLRGVLYYSGLLSVWHRIRNRNTLTVAMFHRVLPPSSPQYAEADPVWTVSSTLFRECLEFFVKEYRVISLEDIRRARRREKPLPKRALLITFDDGWEDNIDYALGSLRSAGLPATLFVVAGLVRQAGTKSFSQIPEHLHGGVHTTKVLPHTSADDEQLARHMLSAEQLKTLSNHGVGIESHGLSHIPVTQFTDRTAQFSHARTCIARLLSIPEQQAALALSFPHGKYDAPCVHDALAAGHDMLFTSDCCLNDIRSLPESVLFGRIHIPGHEISGPSGQLRPELLARWLFIRPRRTLRVS